MRCYRLQHSSNLCPWQPRCGCSPGHGQERVQACGQGWSPFSPHLWCWRIWSASSWRRRSSSACSSVALVSASRRSRRSCLFSCPDAEQVRVVPSTQFPLAAQGGPPHCARLPQPLRPQELKLSVLPHSSLHGACLPPPYLGELPQLGPQLCSRLHLPGALRVPLLLLLQTRPWGRSGRLQPCPGQPYQALPEPWGQQVLVPGLRGLLALGSLWGSGRPQRPAQEGPEPSPAPGSQAGQL